MKEAIQKRMEELMAQGRQLETQIHMINGALEQCKWQLTELEKQDASTEVQDSQSV
jgi:chaperonin cofactor prefoldin